MSTAVAFLWHMHQPCYKNLLTNEYSMPWVRFHSTKAYYDMISILEDYPHIRQTFNLVPSLLDQINDYANNTAKDYYLDLSKMPAKELDGEQKKFLLWNFFMANWGTMIKPYPRYWELLNKRGTSILEEESEDLVKEYSLQDYRDLQVWYNITWFGYRARKRYPQIQELINKGTQFTEEDKGVVLETQNKIIKELIPLYKKAQDEGRVEITISPFYHPILPLVYDTDIAKRCMPWVTLPHRFHQKKDVVAQIKNAVNLYKKMFGKKPKGIWPSEGSVCPEIIPLLAKQGIKWLATDEEILLKTIQVEDKGRSLYAPYNCCINDASVIAMFRDRGLSNALSFTYPKQDSHSAANDLIRNLYNINKYAGKFRDNPIVTIVLDGENPWEYYSGGGESFLRSLYEQLGNNDKLYTTTISKYLEDNPAREELTHLYSGSWIASNFDIWIGDPEENKAWNYIGKTREFLVSHEKKVDEEKRELAWQNLYAAEGSDWFWWYGEDFQTDCDEEFDNIFRNHLANVYRVLGFDVPDYLKQPVIKSKEVKLNKEPYAFITPKIDGENTYYYEWTDAGRYHVLRHGGSKFKYESYISDIYFGFDQENLFVRIDPLLCSLESGKSRPDFYFNIIGPTEYRIVFPLALKDDKLNNFTLSKSVDSVHYEKIKQYDSISAKNIIEFSIPFSDLDMQPMKEVHFFVQIKRRDKQLGRYPDRGYISFKVPDKDFELDKWMV